MSHMVQTCWLPDPNERPTFSTLKEVTWESLSACIRAGCNPSNCPFTSSTNDDLHTRYKMIRNCNPIYRRQNNSTKTDEYIQGYADLEISRGIELPSICPNVDKYKVEYSGESEEEIPLKQASVKSKHNIHNGSTGNSKWVCV